jgi:hypothetical protein
MSQEITFRHPTEAGLTTLFVTISRRGLKYLPATGAGETPDKDTWPDYGLALAPLGDGSREYVADFPATITAAGDYDFIVQSKAGENFAADDPLEGMGEVPWNGSAAVEFANLPTVAAIAAEILVTPDHKLATDADGNVAANNTEMANLDGKVSDAVSAAEDAADAADSAALAAGQAKTAADSAKTAADGAKTSADGAKTSADGAKTSADTAATAAGQAKTAADTAATAAGNAATAADQAKTAAEAVPAAILAVPENLLATDELGRVTVANLPAGGGDGDIAVDHHTGGVDALRYVDAEGVGVDNGIIRAYLKAEWDAGTKRLLASAYTGTDGHWIAPMMLNAGTYYLDFAAPGRYGVTRVEVIIA